MLERTQARYSDAGCGSRWRHSRSSSSLRFSPVLSLPRRSTLLLSGLLFARVAPRDAAALYDAINHRVSQLISTLTKSRSGREFPSLRRLKLRNIAAEISCQPRRRPPFLPPLQGLSPGIDIRAKIPREKRARKNLFTNLRDSLQSRVPLRGTLDSSVALSIRNTSDSIRWICVTARRCLESTRAVKTRYWLLFSLRFFPCPFLRRGWSRQRPRGWRRERGRRRKCLTEGPKVAEKRSHEGFARLLFLLARTLARRGGRRGSTSLRRAEDA